jgi:hypothetical protein
MRNFCKDSRPGAGSISVASTFVYLVLAAAPAMSQTAPYRAPRAADGHPDLNGIWQVLNTADWSLEAHAASAGTDPMLGALGAVPPGQSVIEGGVIPYLPGARAKQQENFAKRQTEDPAAKCYMPGVPRATYMPYPFQIVQSANSLMFVYQFADAVRTIYMNDPGPAPADSWMGWSKGHWEGDTLVVDVTSFNDQTWFDRAGDYHSDALHVVERYTPRSADTMMYEATIEDPKVFSRPWKISMPLYRHVEKDAHLMEFKCIEFSEELLYGHLRKKPTH